MRLINETSLPASVYKRINNKLYDLCRELYRDIPLDKLFEVFEDEGMTPVQEDGTRWSGFLTGREGRASIEIMFNGEKLKRALTLTWYKMDSGRYEIVAYFN